jgi:lysophospholipase L1-like esterase
MNINIRVSVFSTLLLCFFLLPIVGEGGGKKKEKIKVACIGDSITFGARLENPEEDSYPARLQRLLGEKYLVENFGVSSCTLIRKGIPTVWNQLSKIKEANPNIMMISLGTNDTCGEGSCGDRKCWEYKDEFEGDYSDLIDTLRTWPSRPRIWVCAPSPMVLETPGLSEERVQGLSVRKPRLQELNQIIKKVAENKKVGFIDLNTPLTGKAELFTEQDGVHPNKDGYNTIAKLVYREIKKEI